MEKNSHITITEYTLEQNNLLFYFTSKLYLSGTFYIKPFGTSRTRYENKNIFQITNTFIQKTNMDNHYEIRLIKNEDEIKRSRNARLFYNDKFDIQLELWMPQNSSSLNLNVLHQLIPHNYGKIVCNLTEQRKYKLGIIVPFYSRADYVIQFMNSLKNTNLDDCLLLFIDESLTKDVNEDHTEVNRLITKFHLDNVSLIKIYKNKHGNMFDSILYGMDLLYNYCDFLSTIDSDTIHNKNWIEALFKSYDACVKHHPEDDILLSGFNVESPRHSIIEKKEEYILKNSVGGCHMFFSKMMYIKSIRRCLMSHKWDSNIIESVKEFETKIITTNPSVIQHIGIKTSINRCDDGTYDTAADFCYDESL